MCVKLYAPLNYITTPHFDLPVSETFPRRQKPSDPDRDRYLLPPHGGRQWEVHPRPQDPVILAQNRPMRHNQVF